MAEEKVTRRNFVGAAVAGLAAVGAGLAGCSSGSGSGAASAGAGAGAGAAAAPISTSGAKPVILVVSFGTSYNDSRRITIGGVESAIAEAFWPDYEVRRAFTSQTIIDKLAERDGVQVDNVTEALERCINDGVSELIVQPTHLMGGYEYQDIVSTVGEVTSHFAKVSVGDPLLTSDDDYKRVIAALKAMSKPYDDGETAFVFMGHGTEAESNEVYATLQKKIGGVQSPYVITTVEAEPDFEDALASVQALDLHKAVLRPLMVVAGDHANNDMANLADPESLASILAAADIEVTSVLEGLGQNMQIQDIYVSHVRAAIEA